MPGCGFLGCLGVFRKPTPSLDGSTGRTSSSGGGGGGGPGDRHSSAGERLHRNSRNPGGLGASSVGGPGAGDAGDARAAAAGLSGAAAMAQYEGDGAPPTAAALAAATQPASLVKMERGAGGGRRTPLHAAAERGQLHVLSALIESLCCSATAVMLIEAAESGSSPGSGNGSRPRRAGSSVDGADGSLGSGPDGGGGGGGGDFPLGPPGAGGAPLAPDQYIQFHLNMQDAEGTTALSLACRHGHVDCCRLLLANGAGRALADARGNTPLHYAALRGYLGVLFMLLDEFMEAAQQEEMAGYVDARNHAGCTPLHYAVWGRQSGSVQVLLQHGADVLPRNSRPAQELTPAVMVVGSTPLHLAAARGHVEICRILLKTFAERVLEPLQLSEEDPQPPTLAALDPRVQLNANGHMPYQVAQRLGFYPLAMLLRPSIPVLRLFSEEERAVRFYGPPPLRALAAEALNKKLLAELDALAAAPPPPTSAPTSPAKAEIAAAAAAAAVAAPLSRSGTGRRGAPPPLSVPSGEIVAIGGGSGGGGGATAAPQSARGGGALPAVAAEAGSPASAGGRAGPRPRTPAGATTPNGGAPPLSPSLLSPMALTPSTPAGAPQSPSADGARASLAARAPSARRSTPPRRDRSSNGLTPAAAPMLAAPSGRAPGQLSASVAAAAAAASAAASPSHAVVMSLPGQAETEELVAAAAAAAAAEDATAAANVTASTDSSAADDVTRAAAAAVAAPTAAAPGPRTPARQPSAGTLHARRSTTGGGGGGGGSPAAAGADSRRNTESSGGGGERQLMGSARFRAGQLFGSAAVTPTGPTAATVGTSGGPAPAATMPSLTEDVAEGEDGSSEAAATAASSCAAVTPFERPPGADSGSETRKPKAGTAPSAAAVVTADADAPTPPAVGGGAIAAVMSYGLDEGDEELECGVCMEPLPLVGVAPCRHQLCGPCARRICCLNIQKPSHCPFCRTTITAFIAPPPPPVVAS